MICKVNTLTLIIVIYVFLISSCTSYVCVPLTKNINVDKYKIIKIDTLTVLCNKYKMTKTDTLITLSILTYKKIYYIIK